MKAIRVPIPPDRGTSSTSLTPFPREIRNRQIDVGHGQGDVVESSSASFDEPGHDARLLRFEQLQVAVVSYGEHALDEPVAFLGVSGLEPEVIAQGGDGGRVGLVGEGNVMEADHSHADSLAALSAAFRLQGGVPASSLRAWYVGPVRPGPPPPTRGQAQEAWSRHANRSNLERHREVRRPFAHRPVIDGNVLVAQECQYESVAGGRDPSPAVRDGSRALRVHDRSHELPQPIEVVIHVGLWIDEVRRGHVDGARNVAGPRVIVRLSPMLSGTQRVDDAHFIVVYGGKDLLFTDQIAPAARCFESGRRERGRRVERNLPAFRAPLSPSTVEHDRVLEAEGSQHPPHTGGPHVLVGVVQHEFGAATHRGGFHRRGETLFRRHHVAQVAFRVGKVVQEINVLGGRDMAFLPSVPAASDMQLPVSSLEDDGAVEHPQIGRAENALQPGRLDEGSLEAADRGFPTAHPIISIVKASR